MLVVRNVAFGRDPIEKYTSLDPAYSAFVFSLVPNFIIREDIIF